MMLDVLENARRYLPLNKGLAKAIEFLLRPDLKKLPVEKYELHGDRIHTGKKYVILLSIVQKSRHLDLLNHTKVF